MPEAADRQRPDFAGFQGLQFSITGGRGEPPVRPYTISIINVLCSGFWQRHDDCRHHKRGGNRLEQHLARLSAYLGQHFGVVYGLFAIVHIAQTAPCEPQSGFLAPLEDARHPTVDHRK